MKLLISIVLTVFSVPAFACIDLSGIYEKPIQDEIADDLDLQVVKQNDCSSVHFYNAWINLPTNLYLENPNPISYKLDGQEHCNAFGSCYTATVNDQLIKVNHPAKEYKKSNGEICISGNVSFGLNNKKFLYIIRDCSDGSKIEETYKIH